MSNVIITPNMSLPTPVPGQDPGIDYADNNNQAFNIVDGHNHSPGSGVQITPLGLNVNIDLDIQSNDLANVSGVDFSSPASSSETARLYTAPQSGGGVTDLFYNDGAGNIIPLTKAGIVNATAASIPGESYSGGTFTWKQGAGSTTPANFDIGSVTVRPNTAGTTNGITISPPSAIASQYSLALPALPPAQQIMTLDNSGNITAPYTVDASTIVISSNVIQVPTGGITATQIASATITGTQVASDINLPGKNVEIGGNNAIASNTNPATNGLTLVRGFVDGGGSTINSGEGFSSTLIGTGRYTITFTTAFLDIPVVTANAQAAFLSTSQPLVTINSVSATSFSISIYSVPLAQFQNFAFMFIAIGQRA